MAAAALRQRFLFAALYLSEGAPIGFLWWFLPAQLRVAGLPIGRITALTAALALPWACKVFWAPLLDAWRGPRWGYRSWMLAAQLLMGLALVPLAWLDLVADFGIVYALCLAHAVLAATQDVAIDALAIATTPPGERGAINGWMQAGMLLGRSVFGGLALAVAASLGVGPVVFALCVVIWAVGLFAARTRLLAAAPPPRAGPSFLRRLGRALWHRRILRGLAFALVAGAGFEALGGVAGPYLVDRGYDRRGIGTFLGVVAVACMLAGALYGGRLADRLGARRTAGLTLVAVAAAVAGVAFSPAGAPLFLGLAAFYATIGLFTASSYALFMDLTEPAVGATQFTAFMAATNLCEAWSVFLVGRLAARWDYAPGLLVLAGISLAGLAILRGLRAGMQE